LFDIGINGWSFEDFTLYDASHQVLLLNQSKSKISSILGITPTIFIPPYGRVNQDTFSAMQDNGIYYVATTSDIVPPETISDKIYSIPVTVFAGYYHLENGTLQYMTNDMMMSQIQNSIQNRGFAVVTLNFQDYALENGTLKVNSPDPSQIENLESLIDVVRGAGLQIVKVDEISNKTGVTSEIPPWAKLSAQSWSQDNASNSEFLNAIQFMIKQNTIKSTTPSAELKSIPNWLKHDAMWWSSGLISDQEFASIIEYLIEVRAIS
jgi:hypothetical protein